MVRRQFLARRLHAAALALMLCLPSAHAARLDATTIGNGVVSMDYAGSDAGQGSSNLRLTSMGRWLDARDADRYTVWRLRNNGSTTREVRLEGYLSPFAVSLTLRPRSDTYVRSPIIEGTARHRLLEGSVQIASVTAGTSTWSNATAVPIASGPNRPPVFLNAPERAAQVGRLYRHAALVEDPDGDLVALSAPVAPGGYTFDADPVSFRFLATSAQLGAHAVSLRVDDGRGGTATQQQVLRVHQDFCAVLPIAMPKTRLGSATPGQNFSNLAGGGGANQFGWVSWTGAPSPATLANSLVAPGDSQTYANPDAATDTRIDIGDWAQGVAGSMDTPEVRASLSALLQREIVVPEWRETRTRAGGTDYWITRYSRIQLTAFDLAGAGTLSFTYFGPADCYADPPVASDLALETPRDTSIDFALSAFDPEGDQITYYLTHDPAHGTVSGTPPALRYTPAAGFIGSDRILYKVMADGLRSETAQVTFTVTDGAPANQPPVATPQALVTARDAPLAIVLAATDADGDALTFRISAAPAHGTMSGTPPDLTYTPAPGYAGSDAFAFVANDGVADSVPATVQVMVTAPNSPPRITTSPLNSVGEGAAYAYDIDATDPDAGDVLAYGLDTAPGSASIVPASGLVSWNPAPGLASGSRAPNTQCRMPDSEIGTFQPRVKWQWNKYPVLSSPAVAPLTDTNADGRVDTADDPVVVVVRWYSDCARTSVHALDGSTGAERWSFGGLGGIGSGSHVAIGDIDADGSPEVIALLAEGGVVALTAAGQVKWTSIEPRLSSCYVQGAPTIADLDGDGQAEILVRGAVLNSDGSLRSVRPNLWHGTIDTAVDLDGDGIQEVLSYDGAYRADGSLFWRLPDDDTGRTLIPLNVDADPEPEIAYVGRYVGLVDHLGQRIWRIPNFNSYNAGPLAAGDLDGDGRPELVALLENNLRALRAHDGSVLWSSPVVEPSHMTGVVIFDFEGDGRYEAIYADEQRLRVYDGQTGAIRFDVANPSATATESPSVADVDNDGHAELIISSDNGPTTGVRVIEDLYDSWRPTRNIWNQYQYAIDNIGDDLRAPPNPLPSWLTHNTFRSNDLPNAPATALPDLAVHDVRLADEVGGSRVTVQVSNRGLAATALAAQVRLYNGAPDSGGVLLAEGTMAGLAAGATTTVDFGTLSPSRIDRDLQVVVDAGNVLRECVEDNNRAIGTLFAARATDPAGLHDAQRWTVSVEDVNAAPSIATAEIPTGMPGQAYRATIAVADPDLGDAQQFSLVDAPAGMTINEVSGELLWYVPLAASGDHAITVRTMDLAGATGTRAYTLRIEGNNAPRFTSAPVLRGVLGGYYTYDADAIDLEGDAITYELVNAPAGMGYNATNGQIYWTPTAGQLGAHPMVVRARDARGAVGTQSFSIEVSAAGGNRAPVITSTAPLAALAGTGYRYDVDANDPDGDALIYQLAWSPSGMTIDPATGLIAWTPTFAQAGSHLVRVRASDHWGAAVLQEYYLVVTIPVNHLPEITSTPATTAKVGREYRYDVEATDADGDALVYSLRFAPASMSIDPASGLIRWTPSGPGVVSPIVRVADPRGYVEQQWTPTALPATTPLATQVVATPEFVVPGGTIALSVSTTGAAGPVVATVSVGAQTVPIAANGTTELTAPVAPGCIMITVVVTDGYETSTGEDSVCIGDPSDTTPPVVTLLSPADGSEVTAPVAVRGSVQDANLSSWTLAHRPANSPAAPVNVIAQGTSSFSDQAIGRFDPTLLLNGQYALILQATDTAGRTSSDSVVVRVTGDMKVGHFSVTFEDASVPLAGIPVRVTRTYDTRQRAESLDFGHGWSVDYQNVRIHESAKLGYSWRIEARNGGFFPLQCAVSNGDRVVTVTLPDGEVETFRAKAEPECGEGFTAQTRVQMVFEPMDDTHATLEQSTYGLLAIATTAGSGVYNMVDPEQPNEPADPRLYRLTTPEGLVYELDQSFGIRQVIEPGGQSLTYSTTGVVHTSGVGIQFVRDPQGRIRDLILPDGGIVSYVYTASGDLDLVRDPVDQTTRYTYGLASFPHYLTEIADPRGVRAVRNEYDDDGRLVATIDADGHRIAYTHDIDGRTEQVRDRRGNLTQYVYDDNGWVLAETNALGETTQHTYDANGNELTRTDPLGHVTAWTYDVRGNALTETNALGQTTTSTYDGRNSLLTQVDPMGRTVIANTYHPRINALVATADALGNATTFDYDTGVGAGTNTGELVQMTDALGHVSRYELDQAGRGWRVAEVDALGNRTTYTHDAAGRVLTETRTRTISASGGGTTVETLVTSHEYDTKGRLVRTVQPDGSFSTIEYNGIDKPVLECNALEHCTSTGYDHRGNVSSVQFAGGAEITRYDPNGNAILRTDANGNETTMVYDAANRLIETVHPDNTPHTRADNPRATQAYDAAGRLISTTDERGNTTTYTYDAANRRLTTTAPPVGAASAATTTNYDASGRRLAETDPNGNTTSFTYDAAGRLTETLHADGMRSLVEYDALGRKIAEIDPASRRTEYAYDALGRLTAVTLAAGTPEATVTRYAYDEAGNRTAQTDAEGRITHWTFDAAGREVARTLPLGQSEQTTYDEAGDRLTHTDFRGRTTTYLNSGFGRLSAIDYPNDTDVLFGYTPTGQRANAYDARGATEYAYDTRDRLVHKSDPDGLTIEYTYDAAGNLVSRVSPSQSLVYSYDARNRLETVTRTIDGAPPQVTRYAYDAAGNRREMQGADGTRTEYAYDARHRLASLIKRSAAGALLVGMAYTVDASGMRTAITESDAAGTTRTVAYAYDALKRLTAEAIAHRDPTRNRTSTWTYDRVGNRLTQMIHTAVGTEGAATAATQYIYDANDRLTAETTTVGATSAATLYAYDANGNTVTKTTPSGPIEYVYNDANRLVEMRQSGERTTYAYDADGLRIAQTRYPATGDPVTTRYLQDPSYAYSQVIEQWRREGAGATQLEATYAFADELIAQTRYAGAAATTAFVQADGFGSVRWLTDAAGVVTDGVEYDAFGNEVYRSGSTPTEHLYRGEQFDPILGFYYLRARYMDPSAGRFTQQDAFNGLNTDPRSLHKYLYAHADPINNSDPSGNFIVPWTMAPSLLLSSVGRTVLWSAARPALVQAARRATLYTLGAAALIAATTVQDDRDSPPIFLVGSDHPEVRDHIMEAQVEKGIRPIVHRRGSSHDRSWLYTSLTRGLCGPGITGGSTGRDCDEFPMAIQTEGGRANFLAGRVSVKPASLNQNRSVGARVRVFHEACGIRADDSSPDEAYLMGVTYAPTHWICGSNK